MSTLLYSIGECKHSNCVNSGYCTSTDIHIQQQKIPYLRQIGLDIYCQSFKPIEAVPGTLDTGD